MRSIALICRYGHQDFYRISGRDPDARPLSILELNIFAHCLKELWENEIKARGLGGEPGPEE